uniref:Uncharacterized protein n=1 Tax=Oncorhynchus kisutch TaxID=8019 RepID=A0A8C7M3J7_ONCKI
IHLSEMGVAEIAESTNLKGFPHTFVYHSKQKKFMKKVHFFCMDEEILKRMVTEENAISDAVNMKGFTLVQLMMLPDPSLLTSSQLDTTIGSIGVNLGQHPFGTLSIHCSLCPQNSLNSFISLCLKPEMWQKVAKFKGAEYFRKALYVVNRNRGQGLAKALVSSMSRRLYSQGFPVYCFVEEENTLAAWYQFNY